MTYTRMNDVSKKSLKILLPALLLGAMILIFGMPAFAHADTDGPKGFASGKTLDKYVYTVEVYSGIEGTYLGKTKWSDTLKAGDKSKTITIDVKDVKVNNDKYYARGFRITGHDNDETENSDDVTGFTRISFNTLEEDVSYEVAYGIKGNMVAYTIRYVDEDGAELAESDTYYGMPGDKPVVAYKYIDGYLPHAYSLAKKLSEDESQNVFTFTYSEGGETTTETRTRTIRTPAAPGTRANPAGTAVPGAAAGANAGNAGNNAAGANIGDGNTPLAGPDQYSDLDDGDTPMAEPDEGGSKLPLMVGIGVGLLLLIALIAWLLMRRRNQEDGVE